MMPDESETMKYGPSSINISTKTRGELQRENEELRESLRKLHAENNNLKEFARYVIGDQCWSLFDIDALDVQDKAEKLGLVVSCVATEADVDKYSDFDVGDTVYQFSEILKEDD